MLTPVISIDWPNVRRAVHLDDRLVRPDMAHLLRMPRRLHWHDYYITSDILADVHRWQVSSLLLRDLRAYSCSTIFGRNGSAEVSGDYCGDV